MIEKGLKYIYAYPILVIGKLFVCNHLLFSKYLFKYSKYVNRRIVIKKVLT